MDELKELVAELSPANAEVIYQKFYKRCSRLRSPGQVFQAFEQVIPLARHENPVVRSYCLLFMGAALDSGVLKDDQRIASQIIQFIEQYIEGIHDFRARDSEGQWIHVMSHLTYLVDSLVDHTPVTDQQVAHLNDLLLSTYLRSNVNFEDDEELVLGNLLLKLAQKNNDIFVHWDILRADIPAQTDDETEAATFLTIERNKRKLWQTMLGINLGKNVVSTEVFKPFSLALVQALD